MTVGYTIHHRARGKILAKANRTAIAEFLERVNNGVYRKGATIVLDGDAFPADAAHGDEGTLEYRSSFRGGMWYFVKDGK